MKIQESSQNYISCSWKSWFYLANRKKILVKVKAANSRFATKVHQRCLMGVLSTPPLGQWMKLVQNRHIQASLMVTLNSLKTLIKDLNYWLHVLHDWKSKKNFKKKEVHLSISIGYIQQNLNNISIRFFTLFHQHFLWLHIILLSITINGSRACVSSASSHSVHWMHSLHCVYLRIHPVCVKLPLVRC